MIRKRQLKQGFTLIELMVTVAVLGVILTLAAPSFSDMLDRRRLVAAGQAIFEQVAFARSEAIKRNKIIYVRAVVDGTDDTVWALGISEFTGCDPTIDTLGDPVNTDACLIRADEDVADASTAPDDWTLRRIDSTGYGIPLSMTNATLQISFDPVRGTASGNAIAVEGAGGQEIQIVVSTLGRVRQCSSDHVGGLPGC